MIRAQVFALNQCCHQTLLQKDLDELDVNHGHRQRPKITGTNDCCKRESEQCSQALLAAVHDVRPLEGPREYSFIRHELSGFLSFRPEDLQTLALISPSDSANYGRASILCNTIGRVFGPLVHKSTLHQMSFPHVLVSHVLSYFVVV